MKRTWGKLGRNSNKEAEIKEHGFKNSRKKQFLFKGIIK